MDNYYIFKHRRVAKRSVEPNQNYEQLLADEIQVNVLSILRILFIVRPIYIFTSSVHVSFVVIYLVTGADPRGARGTAAPSPY